MLKCELFSYAARRLTGKAIKRGLTKRELCVESHRTRSKSSLHVSMSISVFLLFITANQAFPTDGCGAEWNPTGNPIGGGPGYSDSVRHQDADYYVTNKGELLGALSSASFGDIVYVVDSAEIDMSGEQYVYIPAGVTLASGRGRTLAGTVSWGGLLYCDNVGVGFDLLRTGGDDVRITGLRIRGPYSMYEEGRPGTDSFPSWVYTKAICATNTHGFELDNCEIWGFSERLISLAYGVTNGYVHHNFLHDSNHNNWGGAVVLSAYDNTHCDAIVEANLIDNTYGGIGASGDTGAVYEARYNIITEHMSRHTLDKHGSDGIGGDMGNIYIHHNTVMWDGFVSNNVTGVYLRGLPLPGDSGIIENCWFWDDDSAVSIQLYTNIRCRVTDNSFTHSKPYGLSARIPTANIVVNADSGVVADTFWFKATGSFDPNGNIAACYWRFGDNQNNSARHTSINDSVMHVFSDIGMYKVELMVTDDDGCIDKAYYDIKVKPPAGDDGYYLSVWVFDRYHDDLTGYYKKQVLIDDWVCWEQDIAGDEGWYHVVVNVTDSVAHKDSVTVGLKFICTHDIPDAGNMITDPHVFWDNVWLFGANIKDWSFDNRPWSEWNGSSMQSSDDWTTARNTPWFYGFPKGASARSGPRSYCTQNYRVSDGYQANQGDWIKIEQTVGINIIGVEESQPNENERTNMLHIPFPNPSTHKCAISYTIAAQSKVSLKIYDISGRSVKTLVDSDRDAGYYRVTWDGKDARGKSVPNGIYFYRLMVESADGEDYTETRKLVILKK